MKYRTTGCGELRREHVGDRVVLSGWVAHWRDHGGVIFIDLRDRSGLVQVVFNPQVSREAHEVASTLGLEWVVRVEGEVRKRPEGTENPKLPTGEVEVYADRIDVLNKSDILPFPIMEASEITEEVRLSYRYLDLRREKMQKALKIRHTAAQRVRNFLTDNGFWEVETPFLTKSTPEGARDFLVPSRLNPGKFYALPQSPQLFKQILMVAGVEKYFQIVRCFRDEDLRADRQPEFTQIDIEASFVEEKDIMNITEGVLHEIFSVIGVEFPEQVPVISYDEAINKYGSDAPDTRYEMLIQDLTDVFRESRFKVFRSLAEEGGRIRAFNAKGGAILSRKELDQLVEFALKLGAGGLVWIVKRDGKLTSPVVKFFSESEISSMSEMLGFEDGDAIFMIADSPFESAEYLGRVRKEVARLLKEKGILRFKEFALTWVVDFPLFEYSEGRYDPVHHPFTMPREEHIPLLDENPLEVRSRAYDIVLNGTEIGGGSIRIHTRELQEKIFSLIGLPREVYEERFGFLLRALSFGAPPHGGIALGFDRILAILLGEGSIREVIPFPKTQRGVSLMTGAPSEVSPEQLQELYIRVLLPQAEG